MSLAAWQETWLALMLAPEQREQLLATRPAGLTEAEYAALCQTPQERLEAISTAVQRGRISVLSASLPVHLRRLIPRETLWNLAHRYAYAFPDALVYPPAQGMIPWMAWLGEQTELSDLAHLQDLIAYESLLMQLSYYHKPQPPAQAGPTLAPAAGLMVAGPELEALVQRLEAQQTVQDLPTQPLQGWLIRLRGSKVQHRPLHWSVYAVLTQIDGQRTWSQAVQATLAENPELADQESHLLAWENWFRQQGVLI